MLLFVDFDAVLVAVEFHGGTRAITLHMYMQCHDSA
jgi:hypothetical protein